MEPEGAIAVFPVMNEAQMTKFYMLMTVCALLAPVVLYLSQAI